MERNIWIFVCCLLFILIEPVRSLKCLKGQGLPLPTLFNKIEECSAGQVCHLLKVTSGGASTYTGGCQPQTNCPTKNNAIIGKRDSQCRHCCTTDYCNTNGCGAQVISKPARGSLCLDCSFSVQPSQCTDVTMCKPGNICIARSHPVFPGYFEQACVPEATCNPMFKNPYCSGGNASCCSDDFCNDACTPGQPPTAAPTKAYTEILEAECKKYINDGYFYDSYTNLCVKVVKDTHHTYTRQQAMTACSRDNAELMSVANPDEQAFLLFWIFSHQINDTNYWISAKTNVSGSHDYFWADSSPVKYNHWGGIMMGQPDDRRTKDEDCVFLNNKDRYFWHDDRCDAKKSGYICELRNVTNADKVRQCRLLVFNGYFYDTSSDLCIKVSQGHNGAVYSYQQAYNDCNNNGADLVTIDNSAKMDFILRWIFSNHENMTDFWIGAKDIHNNSEFYWPGGQKLSYTHWGNPIFPPVVHGQPDEKYGVTGQNCVYLEHRHEYHWFDEHCDSLKNGYICELFESSTSVLIDKCHHRLYEGYFYDAYSNSCIKAFKSDTLLFRQAARNICTSQGADLVVINSSSKTDFVLEWIFNQKLNDTDFWIGGRDLDNKGHFYWEATKQQFIYTNWYEVTPPPAEDCAYLDYQDKYNWKTSACDKKIHGYVCQINQHTMARTSPTG